jgi:hypothetical protein
MAFKAAFLCRSLGMRTTNFPLNSLLAVDAGSGFPSVSRISTHSSTMV